LGRTLFPITPEKEGRGVNHREALQEVRGGRLRPVYLIYGGEPFLEEEFLREIRAATVDPQTADFNDHVFHPAADQLPQALSVAATQPFFAERRLVVVRDSPIFTASRKKQEEGDEAEEKTGGAEEGLLAYLKAPIDSTCLVFLVSENVDSRKKVTKAVIAGGGAVECKPLKEQDAAMWAQHRAVFYEKKLGDSGSRLLIEKLGPNLRLIDSELRKLSVYVGDAKAITPADVEAAVGGMAETEIFRLTEAVMLKEPAKAMQLLARTLRQVDHPLQVLAALTNRFRQIFTVKALVERGVGLREGPTQAKMHPFAYEKMVGYVRSYSRAEIVQALGKLLEADIAMKSGFDPRLTLETLVVELMG
jgi:DNA polymerase-3 subunit delta